MSSASLLQTIYAVYEVIKGKVDFTVANREQFRCLVSRCGDVVQPLQGIMDNAKQAAKLKEKSLQRLLDTFEAISTFIYEPRFSTIEKGTINFFLLELYQSRVKDAAKFAEFNSVIYQILQEFNLNKTLDNAVYQQQFAVSAEMDRRQTEETLKQTVEVLGGNNIDLNNLFEIDIFIKEHKRRRGIIDGMVFDSSSSSDGSDANIDKLWSLLRTLNGAVLEWDAHLSPKLGHGAFSTVFRGRYEGKDVAIKQFEMHDTSRDLQTLLTEFVILQSIWHPNILRSRGFYRDQCLLVSELAVCSLSDILYDQNYSKFTDFKALDELLVNRSWKIDLCLDIAKGLRYLHANNIIHRDIKSSNILICRDTVSGRTVAKLGDLVLAFADDLVSPSQIEISLNFDCATSQAKAAGADNYKAPELLSKKRGEDNKYTNNSDLYAFGTLINEIMTGRAPWHGESSSDIFKHVVMDGTRPGAWIPDDRSDPRDSILLQLVGSANSKDDCLWHQVPFRRLTADHCCEMLQPYRDSNNESSRSILSQMWSRLPAIPSNIEPLVKNSSKFGISLASTSLKFGGGSSKLGAGGGGSSRMNTPAKTVVGRILIRNAPILNGFDMNGVYEYSSGFKEYQCRIKGHDFKIVLNDDKTEWRVILVSKDKAMSFCTSDSTQTTPDLCEKRGWNVASSSGQGPFFLPNWTPCPSMEVLDFDDFEVERKKKEEMESRRQVERRMRDTMFDWFMYNAPGISFYKRTNMVDIFQSPFGDAPTIEGVANRIENDKDKDIHDKWLLSLGLDTLCINELIAALAANSLLSSTFVRDRSIVMVEAEKKRLAKIEAEMKQKADIEAERKAIMDQLAEIRRLEEVEAERKRLAYLDSENKRKATVRSENIRIASLPIGNVSEAYRYLNIFDKDFDVMSFGGETAIISQLAYINTLQNGNEAFNEELVRLGAPELMHKLFLIPSLTQQAGILAKLFCIINYLCRFDGNSFATNIESHQKKLYQCGIIELTLSALSTHMHVPLVAEHACLVIRSLSANEANRNKIVTSGGCEVLIRTLSYHQDVPRVVEMACKAIINMCVNNDSKKAKLGTAGCCEALVRALIRQRDVPDAVEQACKAISCLSVNDTNRDKVGTSGGCAAIVQALVRHLDVPGVVKQACWAIRVLSSNDFAVRNKIGPLGVGVVSKSLVHHYDQPSHSVGYLSSNNANRYKIGTAGGCEAIIQALNRHKDVADVVEQACGAIRSMSYNSDANRSKIATAGGLEAIIQALQQHQDVSGVVEMASGVIRNMALNSEANKAKIKALDGVAVLTRVVDRHQEDTPAETQAQTALRILSFF